MPGLHWDYVVLLAIGPPLAAWLIASLVWRLGEMILGNIAGTIIIFGSALILMFLEYSELNRLTNACLATASADDMCFPVPSAFARYSIYACIALAQVFGLFLWSLRVEQRIRNRDVAPEWR